MAATPGRRASGSHLYRRCGPAWPSLAGEVELLGRFQGSGCREAPHLLRIGERPLEVSPLLYFVCASLDGKRELAEVAEMVSTATGRYARPDDIAYLVEQKLRPLGLIAGTAEALGGG